MAQNKKTRAKKPTKKQQTPTTEKGWSGWQAGSIWTPIGTRAGGSVGPFASADQYGLAPAPGSWDLIAGFEDVVYSCVTLIADNVTSCEIKLCVTTCDGERAPRVPVKSLGVRSGIEKEYRHYTRKALRTQEVVDHPLLHLLDRPNPKQSFKALIRETQVYLDIVGSAFWHVIYDSLGRPCEFWTIPPQWVTIVTNDAGVVTGYRISQDENEEPLKPRDVIHFHAPDPANPYSGYGVSPLRAAWQRFQLLRCEQSAWQSVLANISLPSLIISPPEGDTLTDPQAERLQKELVARFGLSGQGGPFVNQDNLTVSPLTPPPKDISALGLYDAIKSTICNVYHVPRPLLDLEDSNFASSETARRSFQEYCLKPRINNILETLTARLSRLGFHGCDRLFLAAEHVISPDRTFELQRATTLVASNIMTINEGRISEGLEPVDGGDKFIFEVTNAGTASAPTMQFAAPIPIQKASEGKKKVTPAPADPTALQDVLAAIFNRWQAEVLGELRKGVELRLIRRKAWLPVETWTQELARELAPVLRVYHEQGADSIFAEIGGETGVSKLENLRLNDAVAQAALVLARSTVQTTEHEIGTALTKLREAIAAGLDEGEASQQLTERVREIFGGLTESRASLIAETESSRAKHAGELMAIQESGVKAKKVWLAAAHSCETCKRLDGQVRELDQPFYTDPKGGPYAVVQFPPKHPACACTTFWLLD